MQLSIKYRPGRFCEVIGQCNVVRILRNSILMSRIPKAILFSGIHGNGKTTLARLYAKALNCSDFRNTGEICNSCTNCTNFVGNPFIMELDAASHNGVDDIRALQDRLQRISDVAYKVTILDECHMLSVQAQAAFLKLLEEPVPNRIFLLVTTIPDKLDPTVRSRCLSMPLKPLSSTDIAIGVSNVLKAEQVPHTEDFVTNLSTQCKGSLRDTFQILDQIITNAGGAELNLAILGDALGIVTSEHYVKLATVIMWIGYYETSSMIKAALEHVRSWCEAGIDLRQLFIDGLPKLLRDFSVYLSGGDISFLSGLDRQSLKLKLTITDIKRLLCEWAKLERMMRTTKDPKFVWELYFVTVL